jgi:hypothetical protein
VNFINEDHARTGPGRLQGSPTRSKKYKKIGIQVPANLPWLLSSKWTTVHVPPSLDYHPARARLFTVAGLSSGESLPQLRVDDSPRSTVAGLSSSESTAFIAPSGRQSTSIQSLDCHPARACSSSDWTTVHVPTAHDCWPTRASIEKLRLKSRWSEPNLKLTQRNQGRFTHQIKPSA